MEYNKSNKEKDGEHCHTKNLALNRRTSRWDNSARSPVENKFQKIEKNRFVTGME